MPENVSLRFFSVGVSDHKAIILPLLRENGNTFYFSSVAIVINVNAPSSCRVAEDCQFSGMKRTLVSMVIDL